MYWRYQECEDFLAMVDTTIAGWVVGRHSLAFGLHSFMTMHQGLGFEEILNF
jgi:hypothetical protein